MSARAVLLTFLAVLAVAAVIFAALSFDPNHATADRVVRDAGVPTNVTPGPGGPR